MFAVAVAPVFLTGCPWIGPSDDGGIDPESVCVAAPPAQFDGTDADRLDVGTTTDGNFAALTDGQKMQIVTGPQGGQHFYYTLRVHTGGTPLQVLAVFRDASGAQIGQDFEFADACDETWYEIQNARLVLDSNTSLDGTLTVQLGSCPAEGCPYDETTGRYNLATVITEKAIPISVVAET